MESLLLREVDAFADAGREQRPRLSLRVMEDAVQGCRPGVLGQCVLRIVVGQQAAGTEVADGLGQLGGHGVDEPPVGVVLPVLHHGEVYAGVAGAYVAEAVVVAAVA